MAEDQKTTVGQLIDALRKLPTDMRVVVPALSTGYDDVTEIARLQVHVNVSRSTSYDGRHQLIGTADVDPFRAREDVAVLRYGG